MNRKIDSFAKKNGFSKRGEVAYKRVKDYMVTISSTNQKQLRCCISIDDFSISDLDKRSITRFINKNYAKYRIMKFRWDDSGIDVTFQRLDSKLFLCFSDFVMDVTNELAKVNAKGLQVCAICGKNNDNESSLFYLYGFICGVHKSCMSKFDEENQVTKVNTKRYSNGNLLSGVFGALWGAFIGMLPLLIGFSFFGHESIRKWLFVLAFILPIAVKFYYEVLDGKKSAFIKFIVVSAISLGATLLGVALGNAIFEYSQVKEFDIVWIEKETYYALSVCAIVAVLLNYGTIRLKGQKQAYKVD